MAWPQEAYCKLYGYCCISWVIYIVFVMRHVHAEVGIEKASVVGGVVKARLGPEPEVEPICKGQKNPEIGSTALKEHFGEVLRNQVHESIESEEEHRCTSRTPAD